MSRFSSRLGLATLVSGAALVLVAPSALADSSGVLTVGGIDRAKGAFVSYGEHFKVWDLDADGYSAGMQWTTPSMSGYMYCWASGNGTFTDCDRTYPEGTKITWRICRGNAKTAEMADCSGWRVDYA